MQNQPTNVISLSSYRSARLDDIRSAILGILARAPGRVTNDSVLFHLLIQFGYAVTRNNLKAALFCLNEQGSINLDEFRSTLIARLK